MPENHSTGRGGAGNIGKDDTVYTDGAIVREGPAGESVDGTMSTGRGGRGNVGNPPHSTNGQAPHEDDFIPEPAMREQHQPNFHTGRGGEGNIHKDKYGGHSKAQDDKPHTSIGDKIKQVLGLGKKEK